MQGFGLWNSFRPKTGLWDSFALKLSDLYPINATEGGNIKFLLTWERLRMRLKDARYQLAIERCQKILQSLAKYEENTSDSDYILV
jgi:hypothetical protein